MSTITTLGPVGFNPTGNYDNTRQYEKLDVVYYQGSSYVAIDDSLGQVPTNAQYWDCIALGTLKQFTYDNVASMKLDNSLEDGKVVKTIGYYSVNDGGAATYKIRIKNVSDVVDNMTIISLADNTIIAELIIEDEMNIKQFGAYCDGIHNDKTSLEKIISKCNKIIINGTILINSNAIIDNKNIMFNGPGTIKGYGFIIRNNSNVSFNNLIFKDINRSGIYSGNSTINVDNCKFDNCCLDHDHYTADGAIVANSNFELNVTNSIFTNNKGIGTVYTVNKGKAYINNNIFDSNKYRAINIIVSNYEDPSVESLCDGIISNNYIVDCGKNNSEDTGGVACNGIYCPGGRDLKIDNNKIMNCRENLVEGRFRVLSNNILDGANVDLEHNPTPSVEGVFITGSSENRICEIYGNTFKNIKRRGISCQTLDSNNLINLIVHDNYFDNITTYEDLATPIWINADDYASNKNIYNNFYKNENYILKGDSTTYYNGDISNLNSGSKLGKLNTTNKKEIVNQFFEDLDNLGGFTTNSMTPSIVSVTDSDLKAIHWEQQQYNKLISPAIKFIDDTAFIKFSMYVKGNYQVRLFEGSTYVKTLISTDTKANYTKVESVYLGYEFDKDKTYYIQINCPTAANSIDIVNINYEIIHK